MSSVTCCTPMMIFRIVTVSTQCDSPFVTFSVGGIALFQSPTAMFHESKDLVPKTVYVNNYNTREVYIISYKTVIKEL